MIVISGISISNPSDMQNSVSIQIIDETMNVLKTIEYTGQTVIYYQEASAGTYFIKLIDNTSTESCEINKNINAFITCFDYTIGTDSNVRVMVLDNDNKCVIGGDFTTYSGITYNNIVKTNTKNIIENNFNIGSGIESNGLHHVKDILVDDDNNYIICGDFIKYSGVSFNNIVKIDSSGFIVGDFNVGTGFNGTPTAILFDDGYIIVGYFETYNNNVCSKICKIDKFGNFDTNFNIGGTGFTVAGPMQQITYKIIKDNNNRYLIGGWFTFYNEIGANRIIRLYGDGSIDNSFIYGTGFNNTVTSIIQLNNGQYLIGGDFTTYNGNICNKLVRLNYNGTIDNTFQAQTIIGSDLYIIRSIVEYNNKYYIGGYFWSYDGISKTGIIRLNNDGTLDTTFNTDGTGFSNSTYYTLVENILLLNDGLMVGGYFNKYNNIDALNIIRLDFDGNAKIC